MKIVVIKSPKLLSGFLRLVFKIKKKRMWNNINLHIYFYPPLSNNFYLVKGDILGFKVSFLTE